MIDYTKLRTEPYVKFSRIFRSVLLSTYNVFDLFLSGRGVRIRQMRFDGVSWFETSRHSTIAPSGISDGAIGTPALMYRRVSLLNIINDPAL